MTDDSDTEQPAAPHLRSFSLNSREFYEAVTATAVVVLGTGTAARRAVVAAACYSGVAWVPDSETDCPF